MTNLPFGLSSIASITRLECSLRIISHTVSLHLHSPLPLTKRIFSRSDLTMSIGCLVHEMANVRFSSFQSDVTFIMYVFYVIYVLTTLKKCSVQRM